MSISSQTNSEPIWQILKKPMPKWSSGKWSSHCHPIASDDYEFVARIDLQSLQKFNVVTNDWCFVPMSVPNQLEHEYWTIKACDATKNTLYILHTFDPKTKCISQDLIALDMETGSIRNVLSDLINWLSFPGEVLLIGDELHLFEHHTVHGSANGGRRHLILNTNHFDNPTLDLCPIETPVRAVVHSKSRNSILCLTNKGIDCMIAEYCLFKKTWKIRQCRGLRTSHWPLDLKIVCSADGRHLIISGSFVFRNGISGFIVCNLNNDTVKARMSVMRCPDDVRGGFHLLSMRDEKVEQMVTFGFVRNCFDSEELKDVRRLPRYIIELIAQWVEMEYIHLLREKKAQSQEEGHWRSHIDHILKCCT